MKDKISIIIPIYKVEQYLEQCIASLAMQTYCNIEIVLVNDGSPDGSLQICEKWQAKDNRIVLISKENGGLISAWKTGIINSSGKYLMFVDGDDWAEKDFVEKAYEKLLESNADFLVFNTYKDDNKKDYMKFDYKGEIVINDILDKLVYYSGYNKIIPNSRWSKIIPAKIVINSLDLFDERVTIGEDQLFTIVCSLLSNKVYLMSDYYGYHYRTNENSMINSYSSQMYDRIVWQLDNLTKICTTLSDYNFDIQIQKEAAIYAVSLIHNAFNGKNTKSEIQKIINNKMMFSGAKLIDLNNLSSYYKLMIFGLRKKNIAIMRATNRLYELKQKLFK